MDWLKDKKNQPIVAAIAALVIVGIGVFMWKMMAGPAPSADESAPPADQMAMPPADPNAGAVQPGPAAAAPGATAAPGTVETKSGLKPMEPWRSDPFLPVGYKPQAARKTKPKIPDLPLGALFTPPPRPTPDALKPEPVQPIRRMAGLLLNERVYAIIETNGKAEVRSPGEKLNDGLAVVDRIERDKVVLKTTFKPSRYIVIRMAASPRTASSQAPTVSESPTPDVGMPFPGRPSRRGGFVPGPMSEMQPM